MWRSGTELWAAAQPVSSAVPTASAGASTYAHPHTAGAASTARHEFAHGSHAVRVPLHLSESLRVHADLANAIRWHHLIEVFGPAGAGKTQTAISALGAFVLADPSHVGIYISSSASRIPSRLHGLLAAAVQATAARVCGESTARTHKVAAGLAHGAEGREPGALAYVHAFPRAAALQNHGKPVLPRPGSRLAAAVEQALRGSSASAIQHAELVAALQQVHVFNAFDAFSLLHILSEVFAHGTGGESVQTRVRGQLSAAASAVAPAAETPPTVMSSLAIRPMLDDTLLIKLACMRAGAEVCSGVMIVIDSMQPLLGTLLGGVKNYGGHAIMAHTILALRRLVQSMRAVALVTNGTATLPGRSGDSALHRSTAIRMQMRPALGQLWSHAADVSFALNAEPAGRGTEETSPPVAPLLHCLKDRSAPTRQ